MKNNLMKEYAIFVQENQLKDETTWKRFTDVFFTGEDSADERWRGEYWGKQMRGATLIYKVTHDRQLYDILTQSVKNILQSQDEFGRISSYKKDHEFVGWDIWCRKYVLTGLLHYLDICVDAEFVEEIKTACCRHLDYIVNKFLNEKSDITQTSEWWGAINSCTILEPTLALYKLVGEPKYLEFAKYIVSTGGCHDCDLVRLASENKLFPYQYPVTKAYETMSFFEGLLLFGQITENDFYIQTVDKFVEAVANSDITIIGCAGCTHELFDNSAVKQTEYAENIMQETCVTVTWMRLCYKMWEATKDAKYIDRIERSGWNALYGSLNISGCPQLELFSGELCNAKTFDSYSPLYMNKRGRGIGGFLKFSDGDYGGCCIAIGACGIALMPLSAITCEENIVFVNMPENGLVSACDVDGAPVILQFETDYPRNNVCKITLRQSGTRRICLKIRCPQWCDEMIVNGKTVDRKGYFVIDKEFSVGDTVEFEWKSTLQKHILNNKVAFTYGPIVLAADSFKTERNIEKPIDIAQPFSYSWEETHSGEILRANCCFGEDTVELSDYQSCGKQWSEPDKISVWLNLAK